MKDDNHEVRVDALYGLMDVGSEKYDDDLRKIFTDSDPTVRRVAVTELGRRRGHTFAPQIALRMTDDSVQVRSEALSMLGNLNDPTYHPVILAALKDPNPIMRMRAVWLVVNSHDQTMILALKPLIHDPDPGVRQISAHALEMLSPH